MSRKRSHKMYNVNRNAHLKGNNTESETMNTNTAESIANESTTESNETMNNANTNTNTESTTNESNETMNTNSKGFMHEAGRLSMNAVYALLYTMIRTIMLIAGMLLHITAELPRHLGWAAAGAVVGAGFAIYTGGVSILMYAGSGALWTGLTSCVVTGITGVYGTLADMYEGSKIQGWIDNAVNRARNVFTKSDATVAQAA